MKLVKDWKKIAIKSHSMWANYLGILTIAVPEILFLALGYQVANPYLTTWIGLGLLFYGAAGRLKDQGLVNGND